MEFYKDAILVCDLPEYGLLAGDVGTVVDRHVNESGNVGYSVEFFDMTGRTLTVITVQASVIREPRASDRPTVRAVA